MTDLRAILGDRYDEVIAKVCLAATYGWHDATCPESRDCPWRDLHSTSAPAVFAGPVGASALVALAAVLPDLLAEANTRADEAEAKARRFANLLGNNAKALNDVLPREVLRQKAEAWDEGYDVGFDEARAVQANWPARTPNPYRRGTEGESDRG